MKLTERKQALDVARKSLDLWVKERKRFAPMGLAKIFSEKRGCFVTLKKGGDLRGCIGFPEPTLPLAEALGEAAMAASEDPRFPDVEKDELKKITVEVSVLTLPALFEGKKQSLPSSVSIGKDGLIIRKGFYSGLLLPQVATEWGFGPEEFLNQTCSKAGLQPGDWLDPDVKVYKFQAEVFSESEL